MILLWSPTGFKTPSRNCLTIMPRHALTFYQKHSSYARFSESGFTIVCFYGILVLTRCECVSLKFLFFFTAILTEETMRIQLSWVIWSTSDALTTNTNTLSSGEVTGTISTTFQRFQSSYKNMKTISKSKCEKNHVIYKNAKTEDRGDQT